MLIDGKNRLIWIKSAVDAVAQVARVRPKHNALCEDVAIAQTFGDVDMVFLYLAAPLQLHRTFRRL